VVEFVHSVDGLIAKPGNFPPIPVFPQSSTSFFGKTEDLQIEFHVSRGRASSLTWRINGDVLEAPRVP
jgi:hypothetical protein